MFQRYGVLIVPIIVIGRRAFFGFADNRDAIEQTLRGLELGGASLSDKSET